MPQLGGDLFLTDGGIESATWRASRAWVDRRGHTGNWPLNRAAIRQLEGIRDEFQSPSTPIVISACLGPRGDGDNPARLSRSTNRGYVTVGSALVRAGLETCRGLDADAGDGPPPPRHDPGFGFIPGVRAGVRCEYDVPADAFMAVDLRPGSLDGLAGWVRYHAALASQ